MNMQMGIFLQYSVRIFYADAIIGMSEWMLQQQQRVEQLKMNLSAVI